MKAFRKYLLIFLCLAISHSFAHAQHKVLDKGPKRKPGWVNATKTEYIITYGKGEDITKAKEDALINIQKEIVNSVATYVRSKTSIEIENVNRDAVINTVEKLKNTSIIQTADVPFLQGIALNKAEDFYWEKLRNKSTKEITFVYHVLYPFSNGQLRKIITEFNKKDQEMTDKMKGIKNGIKDLASIEDIKSNILELEYLSEYFLDQRKEQSDLLTIRLKEMLAGIDIVPISNKPGELQYALRIGDKFFATVQRPTYKNSECVKITSKTSNAHIQTIKYDYENCSQDDDNFIQVEYKFNNKKFSKQFYFDVTEGLVEIYLKDDILFQQLKGDDKSVEQFKCTFHVYSKYNGPFTVEKIVLDWKGTAPILFENVQTDFQGKGFHELVLISNQNLDKTVYSSAKTKLLDGTIFYRSKETNEQKRYKIFSQKYNANW